MSATVRAKMENTGHVEQAQKEKSP